MGPLAAIVDWLTRAQLRRQLGALPVLYAFLDMLQVRAIINRHCPSGRADVDHGTVALVLVLNRLTAPRPLYPGEPGTPAPVVGAPRLPYRPGPPDRRPGPELALAYEAHGNVGLEARRREHRALLLAPEEGECQPLGEEGYVGHTCPVVFQYRGQTVVHHGLVVISRPMQQALRDTRTGHFQALEENLTKVRQQIGQRRHRTAAQVQRRAATCCRRSAVGHLVQVQATEENGQMILRWTVDQKKLQAEERRDGRYLLVTNDPNLSPAQMLARYRQKDGLEKRFRVCKQELRVSPIYLHKDERITGMLLIHMLALLTYSLLERQVHRHGLALTTRRIIAALEDLTVIETHCWDGSVLARLTPLSADQAQLLVALAEIVSELRRPQPRPALGEAPAAPVVPGQAQDLSPGGAPWVRLLLAA